MMRFICHERDDEIDNAERRYAFPAPQNIDASALSALHLIFHENFE